MSWLAMRQRCLDPRQAHYKRYGGRGIIIHAPWLESFEAFFSDMGECPIGSTLGRKNNNGNYCPDNCEWQTIYQQANNRSNNRIVEFNGKSLTIAQWAESLGMNYGTLQSRISRGKHPLEKILNIEPHPKCKPAKLKVIPSWKYEIRICAICDEQFKPIEARSRCCTRICSKKLWRKEHYRKHADKINENLRLKRREARQRGHLI